MTSSAARRVTRPLPNLGQSNCWSRRSRAKLPGLMQRSFHKRGAFRVQYVISQGPAPMISIENNCLGLRGTKSYGILRALSGKEARGAACSD